MPSDLSATPVAAPSAQRAERVRLAPVPREQWSEKVHTVLDRVDVEGGGSNLFTTLAHHPRLLKHWIPFAGTMLLRSSLEARERELLIMRTAVLTDTPYEWVAHLSISRPLGFGDAEVDGLLVGPSADVWSAEDATILTAVDELVADSLISESTWTRLEARYSPEQLLEIPMIVGAYVMLGFVVNSLGVEPDAQNVSITESSPRGGTR